jgi:chromosome segregation ATPase
VRELQQQVDEEQRARRSHREELVASERRATLLSSELEEVKSQVEVLERARKAVEADLYEAADRVTELTATNIALAAAKKKLEADMQAVHVSPCKLST